MMKKLALTAPLIIAALAFVGCSQNDNPTAVAAEKARPEERTTLVDVAAAVNADTGEFSTLIAAVLATGLDGVLDGVRPYTVFAPTDAAFAELGLDADNIGDLDRDALTDILLYHVTNGKRAAASVVNARQLRMANGGVADVTAWVDGTVSIAGAGIVQADVAADNGYIHVIDKVMMP